LQRSFRDGPRPRAPGVRQGGLHRGPDQPRRRHDPTQSPESAGQRRRPRPHPAPGQAKSCWYAPRISDRRGGAPRSRDEDYDDRGRDEYRYGRDYDRPPVRRPSDEDYGRERRRYRDDSDDY